MSADSAPIALHNNVVDFGGSENEMGEIAWQANVHSIIIKIRKQRFEMNDYETVHWKIREQSDNK